MNKNNRIIGIANQPPGTRNQTDVDVVQVTIELTGSSQLTVGMKADVYFRFGQVFDR